MDMSELDRCALETQLASQAKGWPFVGPRITHPSQVVPWGGVGEGLPDVGEEVGDTHCECSGAIGGPRVGVGVVRRSWEMVWRAARGVMPGIAKMGSARATPEVSGVM